MRLRTFFVSGLLLAFVLTATPTLANDPYVDRLEKARSHHEMVAETTGAAAALVLDDFELLGHVNLGGGVPNGDVFFYDHGGSVGDYSYVGTWSAQCTGQGAKIIDVNDPTKPRWVGYVGARKQSSNEDVVVVHIGNRDVLGIGVQTCGPKGQGGLALFDVTDPLRPTELSFFPTASGGVHELDLVVQPDGTALALLAVPFAQFFGGMGEVWIVDVTDPTSPVLVNDWSAIDDADLIIPAGNDPFTSIFQGLGLFPIIFAHSVRAADDGETLYASYWDVGVVKLDISDPASPVLLGRTLYPVTADGDAHSMTPFDMGGTRYILQNDEDFDPIPTTALITSSATGGDQFAGIQEFWAPTLLADTGTITDTVFDAGEGCQAADYVGAAGMIALADSIDPFYPDLFGAPPCTIGDQVNLAAAAGAVVMVSNLISIDDPYAYGPDADVSGTVGMPVIQIAEIDEFAQAIRSAVGPVTMTLTPNPQSWGYLRVFAESGATDWTQVGQFVGPATTLAPGSWSIHNTEVRGDRAYSAWYSAGIIALDLSVPGSPEMVGQFVPETSKRHANSLGPGPAEVWGVAIDPETGIIYASEMRTGLWIVRPIGDAAS